MAQLSGVLSRGLTVPVIWSQYEMRTDVHLFDPCWCWGLHDFKSLAKWVSNNFNYIHTEPSFFAILRMLVAPCSSNRQANETYTQASATSTKLLDSKSWPHFVWIVLKRQDEERSWKIYTKIIQHSKSQGNFAAIEWVTQGDWIWVHPIVLSAFWRCCGPTQKGARRINKTAIPRQIKWH